MRAPEELSAPDRQLLGSAAVLVAAVCFGTLGTASRFAYEAGIEPVVLVAWRATIGAVAVALAMRVLARGAASRLDARHLPRREVASLLAAGVAGITLNLAIFTAFELSSIAVVLLGFYTYPAFVALAGAILFRERFDFPKVLALALALGGMVLVVAGPSLTGGVITGRPEGFALAILAALSETVYLLLNRWGHPSVPSPYASLALLVIGALGFTAIALVIAGPASLLVPIHEPRLLTLMTFLGTVGAGIPTTLNLIGTRAIGATRTAILALAEPVVGVVLAALLLGEVLQPVQAAGGVLIVVAAALLQRSAEAPARLTGERRSVGFEQANR
jgi:DME family drug/metabolite transporter